MSNGKSANTISVEAAAPPTAPLGADRFPIARAGPAHFDLHGRWTRYMGGQAIDTVIVPGSYRPVGQCMLEYTFAHPWPRPGPADRIFLVTEGVLASAEFEINGHPLGRAGPWATYRFEIPSGALKPGGRVNTLRATVRDISETFGPMSGRRFDGGLARPIYLERRPPCFIESFHFRAGLNEACTEADCAVAVTLNGMAGSPPDGHVLMAELSDRRSGEIVARAEQGVQSGSTALKFSVSRPLLWSPEMPNLYALTVRLADRGGGDKSANADGDIDQLSDIVGFRRIETRGHDFFVNNKRLPLKSICRHEFTSASGYSPSPEEIRHELAQIKRAGFNAMRLVHSPQSKDVCRIAAEIGLFVTEEPGTCFHNLADEAVAAPAVEALRRTILRDRNVPSVFAWLIYNECNPDAAYAARIAAMIREMDPDALISMADCSQQVDNILAMAEAAKLSYIGINLYYSNPEDLTRRFEPYGARPLVITEWGGNLGQGNPRVLANLCDMFVAHTRPDASPRVAGCSFWVWADYEEFTRRPPASIDGWTIEGLLDKWGRPKADMQTLSTMCLQMDSPPATIAPTVEVLASGPRREGNWTTVNLSNTDGDQSSLEKQIEETRGHFPQRPPAFGEQIIGGIPWRFRDVCGHAAPLLIGPGRETLVVPIHHRVRAVAVLGHVAAKGGYPSSSIWSVHHRDAEPDKAVGSPASDYVFAFADGNETRELLHGVHILRSNNICRWWLTAPRSGHTIPAMQTTLHPSYEILRVDLWECRFPAQRLLNELRWTLRDEQSIQAMYAVSVLVE